MYGGALMENDLYNGQDPLDMPLYTYADASRYIKLPVSTVQSWAKGRNSKSKIYKPLINAVGNNQLPLSFHNLVELHVLSSLKRIHNISPSKIRQALESAKNQLGIERVLLNHELYTFGRSVFLEHLGEIVNLNKGGQIVLKEILKDYLSRVERNDAGIPIKLFPIIHYKPDFKEVSIDPCVSFGRPVITGTGISAKVVANRVNAGESVKDIAKDYNISEKVVTQVLFYENVA